MKCSKDITLKRSGKVDMASGSYILSGQDITLLFARKLAAGSGAYALDGQDVNFSFIFLVLVGETADHGEGHRHFTAKNSGSGSEKRFSRCWVK